LDRLLEATYRAEQNHFWFRGFARFIQPLVEEAVNGVARPEILDCGCGTGANMKRLSRYGRVTGFDISHPSAESFVRASPPSRLPAAASTS
jgi:SAM-dependent methyltransferase